MVMMLVICGGDCVVLTEIRGSSKYFIYVFISLKSCGDDGDMWW